MRSPISISRLTVAATVLGLVSWGVKAQVSESDLRRALGVEHWTAEELRAFDRGDAVLRTLPTDDKQELASLGVVRIRQLPAIQMQIFRESLNQKGGEELKSGGKFSDPPRIEDLIDLELDSESINQLGKCAVGNCDLNLSTDMIRRFQSPIDRDPAALKEGYTIILREMLVRLVRDYTARGDKALGTYDNRRKPVDLAVSHRSLLGKASILRELAPEFADFFRNYPTGLDGVDSSMHWSVVDFGLKPSITVSHSAAYSRRVGNFEQFAVVSKQIYSSRYLDCSLSMTFLVPVATVEGSDTYLIFWDRSRSDTLEGPLGGFARDVVQRESHERIRGLLDRTHLRLLAATRQAGESEQNVPDTSIVTRVGEFLGTRFLLLLVLVAIAGALLVTALWRR